jgi:hypothetical protein
MTPLLDLALLLVGLADAAQDSSTPPPSAERHTNQALGFALDLPAGWRQITPDEAFQLAKKKPSPLPPDLLAPNQAAFYPYGDIDRWLAGEFDGRCMTAQLADGEYSVDEAGLDRVRAAAGARREGDWRREMLSVATTEVGARGHPAIECVIRVVQHGPAKPFRSLVFFVPTGGKTLICSFRATESDFEAALPLFRTAAATMNLARRARGPSKLTDRLLMPILIGALVGLLLLVLHRGRRSAS